MDSLIDAFKSHLKYRRFIVDYTFIAGAAFLVYDYLLTIHLEIKLIWSDPWNYTRVLFLLARYIPLINIFFFLEHQLGLNTKVTFCQRTAPVFTWLTLIGILSAEVILFLRTWAAWTRDKIVGLMLLTIFLSCSTFSLVSTGVFLQSMTYAPIPYHGYRGCNIVAISGSLEPEYISLAAADFAVLLFMTISAVRAYRSGDNGELINVVHRDGMIFYAPILLCSVGSVIIARVGPVDLMNLLIPIQASAHSVIASRIVFNIRRVARRRGTAGSMFGLHSEYREMGVHLSPLARYYLYDDIEFKLENDDTAAITNYC